MIPKISFITAVKNRSKELQEMLESLIDQDMQEWEAVIVDDNSTEPVEDVVRKFDEPRFRFFHLPDGLTGVSNARNFAIEKAKTEIMVTADGDDVNWPARAHVTYEIMEKNQCNVFYSHIVVYFSDTGKRYDYPFQPFDETLFRMANFITNPSTAFKKDIFKKVGGFDPNFSLSEDYDLYLRILNAGGKFCYSPLVLAEYRIGSQNVTVQKKELMHKFVQQARIKNDIPPVNFNEIQKYAEKYAIDFILKERQIWQDERFNKK